MFLLEHVRDLEWERLPRSLVNNVPVREEEEVGEGRSEIGQVKGGS